MNRTTNEVVAALRPDRMTGENGGDVGGVDGAGAAHSASIWAVMVERSSVGAS